MTILIIVVPCMDNCVLLTQDILRNIGVLGVVSFLIVFCLPERKMGMRVRGNGSKAEQN